jgi:hypothetical protein
MARRLAWALVVVPTCLGCGSDDPFEPTPPFSLKSDVKVWANSASAVGVYVHAYEAIGVADGALTFGDPACPTTSDDGTTLTITGGCTDSSDREWTGEATVVRDGGERTLTLDAFDGNEGTVVVRETGESTNEFVANLVIGGVTTIDYEGSVEGGYEGRTTWNGNGRVERDGVFSPNGSVEATTVDQVLDDACSGQAYSGATTLQAGDDTAVVTYDGATDCDDEQNARLSVNGKDRGLVSGISCTMGTVGRRPGTPPFEFALALAAIWSGISRRRRGRTMARFRPA